MSPHGLVVHFLGGLDNPLSEWTGFYLFSVLFFFLTDVAQGWD